MPRPATPAIAALQAAGVAHTVVTFDAAARVDSFGAAAVAELSGHGVAPGQVLKTLVLALPGGFATAVLPALSRLSLRSAAAALGVARVALAEPAQAQRCTGYVVGGISPLGQRRALPTVVDTSALSWDEVLCSAGRRGWDIRLNPADLIRLTGARTAAITMARQA